MSGIGKTSWADRFVMAGFDCIHCDDLIAEKLQADGVVEGTSVYDVGRWMGLPSDADYPQREALYLAHEADVLRDVAASLAHDGSQDQQLVLDMTGSAIYVDPVILDALQRSMTIVYLAATAAQHDQLLQTYRAAPRPVIWNGLYQPSFHEDPASALARCYSELLRTRARLYAALSHVTLEPAMHQDPSVTVADFLRYVGERRS